MHGDTEQTPHLHSYTHVVQEEDHNNNNNIIATMIITATHGNHSATWNCIHRATHQQ